MTAAPAERLQSVRDTAFLLYKRMMRNNTAYGQGRRKDIVGKKAEEEQQQEEEEEKEDVGLTPHEHERALKGAYRSFVIPGTSKTDVDSYFDLTKPHIQTLIKNQLKEMGSAKIIITLWVIWKKPIRPFIESGPEDAKNAQDIRGNDGDKGRPASPVSTSPQEIDEFEKEEMKKRRSVVKNKLNEWHDWLVDYVSKPIKNAAGKSFLRAKNSILGLYDGVKKTLKGEVGNQKQTKDNTDLTTYENEGDNGGDNYIIVEMSFNSLMTDFCKASYIHDLIQRMLAHIKTQTENPKFHESGFWVDKIMHLYINFHRLALQEVALTLSCPNC